MNYPPGVSAQTIDNQIIQDGECECGGKLNPIYFWKNGEQVGMTDNDECSVCDRIYSSEKIYETF